MVAECINYITKLEHVTVKIISSSPRVNNTTRHDGNEIVKRMLNFSVINVNVSRAKVYWLSAAAWHTEFAYKVDVNHRANSSERLPNGLPVVLSNLSVGAVSDGSRIMRLLLSLNVIRRAVWDAIYISVGELWRTSRGLHKFIRFGAIERLYSWNAISKESYYAIDQIVTFQFKATYLKYSPTDKRLVGRTYVCEWWMW